MSSLSPRVRTSWIPRVLDSLYPRTCCSCGEELTRPLEQGLCWDCRTETLPLAPPWCDRCGVVVAGRVDHRFECSDCREQPPVFNKARSLFHYEGGVRDAIHALKYHRDFSVVPDLARLLLAGMDTHMPEASTMHLTAVPLHPARIRHRGFNQGRELVRMMLKLRPELQEWHGLIRIRPTQTQTRLSKSARRENVRGAFRVKTRKSCPERVLLIDDVMTTGATLDACAKALRRAGAVEVTTLTLARG